MRLAIFLIVFCAMPLFLVSEVFAKVSGPCSDCHTMHNSQDGSPFTFDDNATPNEALLRGDCIGCHAQGSTKIVSGAGAQIPQVKHNDATGDLAAGNFAYILGEKGSGAADSKGHNVIDFGSLEGVLTGPPGQLEFHSNPPASKLTCSGYYGCHGAPSDANGALSAISGSHHTDDSSITGNNSGTSYRFLKGVVGLEATNWQNIDENNHNEYHGHTSLAGDECTQCHGSGLAAGASISDLCVRCHWSMHEIGGGAGPWLRHPSDIVIPNSGDYANYTVYNVDAPVGRVTLPETASATVTPGTDVVTCLSCHVAHGSDYPDLLRWDYTQIIANGGSNGNGCFICHNTKDE